MGPEHFSRERDFALNGDVPEQKIQDIDAIRPSEIELPHLENFDEILQESIKFDMGDSERNIEELPYIEVEKSQYNYDCQFLKAENNKELSNSENTMDNNHESKDVENRYYSTYDERIKQTPKEDSERGKWTGERGESDFIPTDEEIQEILEKYDKDSITYEDGVPDFSDVSESTVEIDNMTENRADNFRQCDEKCAEQWNREGRDGRTDWTPRDVAQWRKENGYSWHERNDMKTCDLVPTKINDYFGHLGGVSECRKRDAGYSEGDDFDE